MRKLFWQMNVTLDGYMEGPNRELDYTANVDDAEFDRYVADMLASIDGILIGRVTYEMFAGYWPTSTRPETKRMNELPKYVFSRTLKKLEWSNARLAGENVAEEVARLKREPGKDLALFGSAELASTLIPVGVIDEYRLFVNPVVLGRGGRMFKNVSERIDLKLVKATTMPSSGVVSLVYQPAADNRQ